MELALKIRKEETCQRRRKKLKRRIKRKKRRKRRNSVTFMSQCANISGIFAPMIFFQSKKFRGGTVAQTVILA